MFPEKYKELWYVRVVMIPIIVGALWTLLKGLERGSEQLEI